MTLETSEFVAVSCTLSKGVFTSERAFEVDLADGISYSGPAPIHFCWNEDREPLRESEAVEKEVNGWVAARVLAQLENGQVAVEVPDGEVIAVHASKIREAPTPVVPPRAAKPA